VPTPRDILACMRTVSRGTTNAPADSPLTMKDVLASEEHRNLMTAKVSVGDVAPDFELARIDRAGAVRFSSFRTEQPVTLIFGSYT
jgi:hypothetical protein